MKAGAAGAIEAVVKAMNAHIDSANVGEQGCGALWSITFNNCKNNNTTNDKASEMSS